MNDPWMLAFVIALFALQLFLCAKARRVWLRLLPLLVLGGSRDQVVTGTASEEIAAKIPCALHMYPHLGHAAYEEAPDFNQIVYDFFME